MQKIILCKKSEVKLFRTKTEGPSPVLPAKIPDDENLTSGFTPILNTT